MKCKRLIHVTALMVLGSLGAPPAASAPARRYTVVAGDNLGAIGARLRCSVERLKEANGLPGDLIRIGQRLVIPDCRRPAPPPQATAAAPAAAPAPEAAPAAAPAPKATPAAAPRPAGPPERTVAGAHLLEHEVVAGDSLGAIAKRYGTSVAQLRRDNGLRRDLIRAGGRLWVQASLPVRARRRFIYTIAPGDTLSDVAARYRMDWHDIARLNRKKDPNRLRVGDRLTLLVAGPEERSTTVGRPGHGRLVNGEQLPPGPGYRRQHPRWAWGTNETITHLLDAIATVRQAHPKVHPLLIGDISRPEGGPLKPHKSHQSGRDADIGFFFHDAPAEGLERFWRVQQHRVNFEASWSLIRALVGTSERDTRVRYIFMSYPVQKVFYDWAKAKGVPQRTLEWVFQYPHGNRALTGKLRHSPGHVGHMHVRFKCPPADVACVM